MPVADPATAIVDGAAPIAAAPQRAGDADRGWHALTEGGYVGCGVPRSIYDHVGGTTPARMLLPNRTGPGAALPYFVNDYTTPAGVEVVTANCLGCHAAYLQGQLVVGLGDASSDFTVVDTGPAAAIGSLFAGGPAGRAEWSKLMARTGALGPRIRTRTVGANPADHIAAVLFAHRDPATLAWSDDELIPLPDDEPVPVDVPAWWLLKKKTAMFYTGAGRGDQARIMMTASVLCVDDVASARAIDADFPDVRAFVLSLEPPRYPAPIDAALAARGHEVFTTRCARCHGTYGEGGAYQTRVIPQRVVGTDPLLAQHAGQFAAPFVAWFNASFYGEKSRLEPGDGYVAPPLDGVWATAPYFHNGSVPTLAAVLDSSLRRDRTWIARGADAYDLDAVGWQTPAFDDDGRPSKWIYDATVPGYANTGHTFADHLRPDDRRALLEYLKSL
jgi:mono/diheme cytochrome c family protein